MSPSRALLRGGSLCLPAAAAALVAGWTFSDFGPPGWFTDALEYLWFADFYRQWFDGAPSSVATEAFQTTRFPPLLPLLLAGFGAGSADPGPSGVLMAVMFTACAALATAWARREVGGVLAPVLCGLAVAISPGWFLLQQISPVSEPLMLALVLAALLLARAGPMTRGRALALALVAGTVPLARSIGIALMLPVVLHLAADRGLGLWRWALAALTVLPFAAWTAFRIGLPQAQRYSDSLSLSNVLDAFGGVRGWLLGQPLRMVEGAAGAFAMVPGVLLQAIAGGIAALALLAACAGWRRVDARFLILYCGIVFAWPFPAEAARLMVPLLPVALVLAARGACMVAQRLWPQVGAAPRGSLAIIASLAVAVSLPDAGRVAGFALRSVDPQLEPYKRTAGYFLAREERVADEALEFSARLVAAMQVLPDHVPAGACVYTINPQMTYHLGRVRAVAVPPGIVDTATARQRLTRCRYLLAMVAPSAQNTEPPMYPAASIGGFSEPLFISFMEVDGRRQPAVGLFDLQRLQSGD